MALCIGVKRVHCSHLNRCKASIVLTSIGTAASIVSYHTEGELGSDVTEIMLKVSMPKDVAHAEGEHAQGC